jgi:hypothetical protein
MDAQAGMLAQLFGRSMALGPEREVSGVWSEERRSAPSAGGAAAPATPASAPEDHLYIHPLSSYKPSSSLWLPVRVATSTRPSSSMR